MRHFCSFSCVIEVHTRCYKLEVFLHKYLAVFLVQDGSMLTCSFYLHYTDKLSTIAVPHRDDTDIIMPINMVTLYD